MKNSVVSTVTGLLMQDAERSKGTANIEGKQISWDYAYQITLLSLEEKRGRLRKYSVDKDCISSIKEQLANVCWGSYISLELANDGKSVIAVNVLFDWAESLGIF
ncbi:hypothetical protein [Ruminococcus sp.]|uniref:hypothetical protein n=1 Tax=Ruminococcus sp. TaxID=41978 RepID=UPI0025D63EB2|nr:hypothetical protein [Ruminococcus sp.]MCI6615566.1 hypothetical protein [Ruminococcus sp.]